MPTTISVDASAFRPRAGLGVRVVRHDLNINALNVATQDPWSVRVRLPWKPTTVLVTAGGGGVGEDRLSTARSSLDPVKAAPAPSTTREHALTFAFDYVPNLAGLRAAASKRRPVRASDAMTSTPQLYVTCYASSPFGDTPTHQRLSFGDDRIFRLEALAVPCAKTIPSNLNLHVAVLMATDTVHRERMALCVIGEAVVDMSTLGSSASEFPFHAIYSGDPPIGQGRLRRINNEAGFRSPVQSAAVSRPTTKQFQDELDVYLRKEYKATWGSFPSSVETPSKSQIVTAKPSEDRCLVHGMYLPRALFYYWASQYHVADPLEWCVSNARLGCLAAGVEPQALAGGTLDDLQTLKVLCWTAVSFARALSSTYDYRGSPYTPPLETSAWDVTGGACVEMASLMTSALLALRDVGAQHPLCRPLSVMLTTRYRIVQYMVVARSGKPFEISGSDPAMCHAVAGLVPQKLFDALVRDTLQTPASSSSSSGAADSTMIYLNSLTPSAFSGSLFADGRKSPMETAFLYRGSLPGEDSADALFGTMPYIGSCIRITCVDQPERWGIQDLLCMSYHPKTNGWRIGMSTREMFVAGIDTRTRCLYGPRDLRLTPGRGALMTMARSVFDETSGLKLPRSSLPMVSDSDVADMLRAAKAFGVMVPDVGWRIWLRVNNDDSPDASRLRSMNDISVADAQKLCGAYGVETITVKHLGSIVAYGGTVCEVCVFVYTMSKK